MESNLLGIDIGGTKCAVIYGVQKNEHLTLVDKKRFATTNVDETIETILSGIEEIMKIHGLTSLNTKAIGISCGGPLDSHKGVILSPPNLPGWDNIPIVSIVEKRVGIKATLQNDANACALAEWKLGAGKGTKNMVFLTFGTGLGAGLILNGMLYSGTNDNAGELGHIRMAEFGPVGYGKRGSLEGFASGGGIAQLAKMFISEKLQKGEKIPWCTLQELDQVTAQKVAEEAIKGDELARSIYETSAVYLGKGLSIVIDLLNPEVIVVGGIYSRNREMMESVVQKIIEREALSNSSRVCTIKPAALEEHIGDYAALSIVFT
ncbi:ROK family protein [Parabacteroides faecis]|uniref:ROK family protein n=1 Tax=Parabacteroides faecis TaxID=1217282 RepID=UPI0021640EC0|nr:ROK family protein [Parabacteroides faecis]MCS2893738.1 ROK family protein [Parabacteroides faecis]UVQ49338.1 ROK family protein [Parabacteroides faecis]